MSESTAAALSSASQESAQRRASLTVWSWQRLLAGFLGGFIAVLVIHQGLLTLLSALGWIVAKPYSLDPAAVTGVPQVVSTAFWGGLWGVVFALIEPRLPKRPAYWILAFLFGALLPSLTAWFIVAPLKSLPLAAGGDAARLLTALFVNGAWGLGTAALFRFGARRWLKA